MHARWFLRSRETALPHSAHRDVECNMNELPYVFYVGISLFAKSL
jgi:hypothetical protein